MEKQKFVPATNDEIHDFARRAHDVGFSTTPVNSRKAPFRRAWQEEVEEARIGPVAKDYRSESLDGVGIMTGVRIVKPNSGETVIEGRYFCALDIDIYDEEVSLQMAGIVAQVLDIDPDTIKVRFGQKPKWLLPFFATRQFRKINSKVFTTGEERNGKLVEHRVEVLAKGQQFVAFGNHRAGQTQYQWRGDYEMTDSTGEFIGIHPKDFPIVSEDQIHQIIDGFHSLCADEYGMTVVGSAATPLFGSDMPDGEIDFEEMERFAPKDKVDLSTREIVDVMREYPASTLPYDDWLHVGMGLFHQFDGSDDGWNLWLKWSRKSPKHGEDVSEAQMRTKWKSFDRDEHQRTFATVIYNRDQFLKTPAGKKHLKKLAKPPEATFNSKFTRVGPGTFNKPIFKDWALKEVIAKNSFGLIYGPPKSGKSFVTLDLCCHLAHGMDWCGIRVAKPMNILYIAGEGYAGVLERITAWRLHHGIPDDEYTNVHVSKNSMVLADPHVFAELENEIEEFKAGDGLDMVVSDTLARAMGGKIDENSNADVQEFIENLQALTVQYMISVLIVHHSRKGSDGTIRGASAIQGSVDYSLSVEGLRGGLVSVTSRDQKDGRGFDPLYFSMISHELPLDYFVDNFGEPVVSAHLEWQDPNSMETPSDKTPDRKLTPTEKGIMAAFEAAWRATDERVPTPAVAGDAEEMRISRVGLDAAVVRSWYYKKNGSKTPEALRQAWNRAIPKLEEKGALYTHVDESTGVDVMSVGLDRRDAPECD